MHTSILSSAQMPKVASLRGSKGFCAGSVKRSYGDHAPHYWIRCFSATKSLWTLCEEVKYCSPRCLG